MKDKHLSTRKTMFDTLAIIVAFLFIISLLSGCTNVGYSHGLAPDCPYAEVTFSKDYSSIYFDGEKIIPGKKYTKINSGYHRVVLDGRVHDIKLRGCMRYYYFK